MARNTGAIKRGFSYDYANTRLDIYADGVQVAYLDPTDGLVVVVDGFDLAGQTLTSVNASGATDMTTWLAASVDADGSDDEDPKYAIAVKVGGTIYYAPVFAAI